jgi:plastocyanin
MMNTKLLASIAVFALVMAVISVSIVQSAYAAEDTKAKSKALKEETKAKTKAMKQEVKTKAKTMKEDTKAKSKALKEETKAKTKAMKQEVKALDAASKDAAKTATTSSTTNSIEITKGSSTPGCESTSSCYSPNTLTVKTGTKVVWTNADSAAHTVTSGKDATPDGTFDSGLIMAGKSFQYTFKSAGTYNYYCMVHPWMTGTVTVN